MEQSEVMPKEMNSLVIMQNDNVQEYSQMFSKVKRDMSESIETFKTSLNKRLDAFQHKMEQQIDQQRSIFEEDYSLFKTLLSKYFDVGQEVNPSFMLAALEDQIK